MPTILDPELQSPLLHHCLVLLYPPEISRVYAACVALRETIEGDREWLDGNCRHVWPHSSRGVPTVDWLCGTQKWYRDGELHRDGDLPAEIWANGTQKWYRDGELHRDGDLPAEIWANGSQRWYREGVMHRDGDLPAVTWVDGTQLWYKEGRLHRDRDLPAVIRADGAQFWFKNGNRLPSLLLQTKSRSRKTSPASQRKIP